MKKVKQILATLLLSLLFSSCYAECEFNTFINAYFDVYDTSDTLVELELWGKNSHSWKLNETDEHFKYAIKYFPSKDWFSSCACRINNQYLLEFWEEYDTDSALVINSMFLLCNDKGDILDKLVIKNTSIEYKDVSKKGRYSKFFMLRNSIIMRLYNDDAQCVYTEKQFQIYNKRFHLGHGEKGHGDR